MAVRFKVDAMTFCERYEANIDSWLETRGGKGWQYVCLLDIHTKYGSCSNPYIFQLQHILGYSYEWLPYMSSPPWTNVKYAWDTKESLNHISLSFRSFKVLTFKCFSRHKVQYWTIWTHWCEYTYVCMHVCTQCNAWMWPHTYDLYSSSL
mgnify:CR=1 FL=1